MQAEGPLIAPGPISGHELHQRTGSDRLASAVTGSGAIDRLRSTAQAAATFLIRVHTCQGNPYQL
jgi:hypothetical protein